MEARHGRALDTISGLEQRLRVLPACASYPFHGCHSCRSTAKRRSMGAAHVGVLTLLLKYAISLTQGVQWLMVVVRGHLVWLARMGSCASVAACCAQGKCLALGSNTL